MKYCTKCGAPNDDDAAFCKSCGAPIPPLTPEGEGTPSPKGGDRLMYPPGYEYDRRGKGPGPSRRTEKDWENECESECQDGGQQYSWFWGAIIILVGIFIIFEIGIKSISGLPGWVYDINLWWVIPLLIGVFVIILGVRVLSRSGR
jgi:hypothetical protein